jgi:hypothetical protein
MPARRKKREKNARNDVERYARYVLEVIVVAVALLLLILLFFAFDEPQSAGSVGSTPAFDSELADYIRVCSQGVPQACDKISAAAEGVYVPAREYDAERERLRQERIVG